MSITPSANSTPTFDLGLNFDNIISSIRFIYFSANPNKIYRIYIPLTDDTLSFNLSRQTSFEGCVKYVASQLRLYRLTLSAAKSANSKNWIYCSGNATKKFIKYKIYSQNFSNFLIANNLVGYYNYQTKDPAGKLNF